MPLCRDSRPPILVWTDRAFENQGFHNTSASWFWLLLKEPRSSPSPGWVGEGTLRSTSRPAMAVVRCRRSYDVSLAAEDQPGGLGSCLVPYLTFPGEFAGRPASCWIDNTAAVAAVTEGHSRASDSAHPVHALHPVPGYPPPSLFSVWVKKAANPAGEPLRDMDLADNSCQIVSWVISEPVESAFPKMERFDGTIQSRKETKQMVGEG